MKARITLTVSACLLLMSVTAGSATASDSELAGRCEGAVDTDCSYCSYQYGAEDWQGYCGYGNPGFHYIPCRIYAADNCVLR